LKKKRGRNQKKLESWGETGESAGGWSCVVPEGESRGRHPPKKKLREKT